MIDKLLSNSESMASKKASIRAFYAEIEELKKLRRIRDKNNVQDNFIEINCEQAEDWVYYSKVNAQRKQVGRVERNHFAKVIRTKKLKDKERRNVLSLSKWDFLR